jgi:hypothetical protein
LAKNIKQLVGLPSPTEFSIGHFVQNRQGFDEVLKQAEAASTVVSENRMSGLETSSQDTLNILMIVYGKLSGILVGTPKTEGIF